MYTPKKSKSVSVDVAYNETILIQNNETGDVTEVPKERKVVTKYFTPNKKFMKLFTYHYDELLIAIGEDLPNVIRLLKCTDRDNSINLMKFHALTGGSSSTKSNRKKRLYEKGIIADIEGVPYLNPAIAIQDEKVSREVWEAFKEKNKTLYNITDL